MSYYADKSTSWLLRKFVELQINDLSGGDGLTKDEHILLSLVEDEIDRRIPERGLGA